jgi:translocation and assembly module TamB
VPPLTLALRASGDTAQISIDRLDLLLPGTSAHLDAPIVIGRDRRLRSGASRFTLESDFSRLPWLDATGRLAGKITLEAPDAALDQLPRIQARLQAAGLHFRALDDITVTRADIDLAQQGSLTRITRAELTLADGNTARLDGGYDHATRAFAGLNIRATIIPAALARFFPAGAGGGDGGIGTGGIGTGGTGSGGTGSGGGAAAPLDFETATLEATLDGPLKNPTHHGALAVSNLRRAPLKPLTLRATWTGTGAAADADLAIHAAAGATTATTATTAATGTAAATTTAGGTGTGIAAAAGTEIHVSAKLASTHAELTRLTYRHAAVERLRLTAPARIAWEPALDIASLVLAAPDAPAENAPAPSPRLALRLAAGASAAAGAGFSGQTGMSVLPCAAVGVGAAAGAGAATEFSLSATELDSAWFADFLDLPLFAAARLHLANADLSGHWRQDGPLAATIKALARLEFPGDAATAFPAAPASPTATASPATPASPAVTASPIATAFPAATVSIDAKTAPDRIDIADFTLSENGVPVATATGRIPLVIHPRQTPAWRFDPAAPFEIDARTAPAGHFWQNLSSAIGITLENPSLHVRVSGSWRTPASTVDVSIDRLEFDPARWPANNLPPVTGLAASLSASAEAVQLDALSIRLAGQPLRASGRILAPKDGWQTLSRASLADFSKLPREFHIELPDTDVAAFAPYSSDLLIPRGHLNASLHLQPDGSLDGTLRLHDGALRPVGPLGAIRDIEIESRLAGRRIEITRATALVGGETLALTGSATLRPGAPPALDLAFRGKNIPFVRRSGFLMRGDIDLRALTDGGITRLAGDITLRDSLFLADIRALWPDTPGGGPASRPPFFSIDAPPFDDWRLDINVRGDRFLRLRTTLATGRLSANFQLGGTLGEPRSVGEITMSEGRVLFPFANFSVGTGRVRITQANPFTPSLDFRATTNTLGHDLTMSLTGAPDDPRLVFSSSPPLSSADILLLVMTGQSPDDGFAYTDQQRAFRLGTYLGQGILEQLLGLDMGEERLSLTSGDKVTRQGRETYKLEYKIDKRWTAVGEYDEFDDYNIGLKWRFYQSKPPKEKKNAP